MPYDDDYDDDQQDDTREQTRQGDKPGWRKRLEARAQRADALEREVAFLKAGVNPEDPKAKYFVKGYDGDLTADAIRAEAESLGLLAAAAADAPKDEIPAEEKQAHERLAGTTEGSQSGGVRDFNAEIAAAETPAEVVRLMQEAGGLMADGAVIPS